MRPMKSVRFDTIRLNASPRCRAKSKRSGQPCKAPAVNGYRVCRMHGARGGAPSGKKNGAYKHGARSAEAIALMRRANMWGRLLKRLPRVTV
jgi:glucans biosynthesis protein